MKFSIKKPNSAWKIQTDYLKARKMPNCVALRFLCLKKLNYNNSVIRNFLRNWEVLHWSSFLKFLWLFMVCKIAHFWYNGATVSTVTSTLIHPQLSVPIRKPSSIHFCTYDQNHKSLSTSSTSSSQFYRRDADLSTQALSLFVAWNTLHFQWLRKTLFHISHPSNLINIKTQASV